mmetsp:Transcript_23637/g.43914  ORF Transcript_23637/g.43914 Transcript_23637/m.43914 type:complete len:316 (+) Transcript_23637:473-1420(+)
MAWSVAQLPSMVGKVVLITGANCGLGLESSLRLIEKGALVVMACRDVEKAKPALEQVQAAAKEGGQAQLLQLDLADLSSVRQFCENFLATGMKCNILMCNAGVMHCPYAHTKDGIEMQFGTNHVGHFLLTNLLLDRIKESQPARIVVLSSSLHTDCPPGGIRFDDLNWAQGKEYTIQKGYGHSKFANIAFAFELAKRLEKTQVFVNAVHPGFVDTNLTRHRETNFIVKLVVRFLKWKSAMNVHDGALTQLFVAGDPSIETNNVRARFFVPIATEGEVKVPEGCDMADQQAKLWKLSEKLVKQEFDVQGTGRTLSQ